MKNDRDKLWREHRREEQRLAQARYRMRHIDDPEYKKRLQEASRKHVKKVSASPELRRKANNYRKMWLQKLYAIDPDRYERDKAKSRERGTEDRTN